MIVLQIAEFKKVQNDATKQTTARNDQQKSSAKIAEVVSNNEVAVKQKQKSKSKKKKKKR